MVSAVSALVWSEHHQLYHWNSGIFHGFLLFQNFVFSKKKTSPVKSHLENTILSNVFNFFSSLIHKPQHVFFYIRNTDLLIENLILENVFNFGKWSNWKCRHLRQMNQMSKFSVGHFSKLKIDSKSRFEMKRSIILGFFFKWKEWINEKKMKNWLTLVFSESDLVGDGLLRRNFFMKKPKPLEYVQVSVVKWVMLNSQNVL